MGIFRGYLGFSRWGRLCSGHIAGLPSGGSLSLLSLVATLKYFLLIDVVPSFLRKRGYGDFRGHDAGSCAGRLCGGHVARLPASESLSLFWPKEKVTKKKWPEGFTALTGLQAWRFSCVVVFVRRVAAPEVCQSSPTGRPGTEGLKHAVECFVSGIWLKGFSSLELRPLSRGLLPI